MSLGLWDLSFQCLEGPEDSVCFLIPFTTCWLGRYMIEIDMRKDSCFDVLSSLKLVIFIFFPFNVRLLSSRISSMKMLVITIIIKIIMATTFY